jgi:hypothetical protein
VRVTFGFALAFFARQSWEWVEPMANFSGIGSVLLGLVTLGSLVACSASDWGSGSDTPTSSSSALFGGKTQRATGKVAPISGGTLLISRRRPTEGRLCSASSRR